jgi:serine/threonine protein kinase
MPTNSENNLQKFPDLTWQSHFSSMLTDDQLSEIRTVLYRRGFILGHQIGSGGFSCVLEVQSRLYPENPSFAVKIINRSIENEAVLESFSAEVRALGSLAHPNVIQFFSHFHSDTFLYLVLEYCPGGSMTSLIAKWGVIPVASLRKYATALVSAVNFCHTHKIAHRDIKPGNMLIDKYDRVKLADFGLAMLIVRTELIDNFCGSLVYSPPELLAKRPFDPMAADIWSLGVSLFEMATGVLPWISRDEQELKEEIITGSFAMPESVSSDLADAIQKMIVVDPRVRATADELSRMPVFQEGRVSSGSSRPGKPGLLRVPGTQSGIGGAGKKRVSAICGANCTFMAAIESVLGELD